MDLYEVLIGTGLAWPHKETVEAFSEQEAVDAVADKLGPCGFIFSYSDLEKFCNPGETVDDYVEAHNLVCCGNNGLYLELINIRKIEENKTEEKICKYKCKYCGVIIEFPENEFDCGGYSHPDGEELLWAHIQEEHDEIFEEIQDFETPFMIEDCYTEIKEEK